MSFPTESLAHIYDAADITVTPIQTEFATSTITLVDPPWSHFLTPQLPNLHALPKNAPDSDTEEGEIVSRVHHHNYPLSPQSSLNVMQGHLELDAGTLHTITISLANTAIGRTFQHLEVKTEIEQLHKKLTDLHMEMSRQPDSECPDGFEENHGHLPGFTIPDADSIMRQARYIKLGSGPIPFALGMLGQEGDPIFQYNLFAAPSYIRNSPTEPLPMWLIDAISGKSSSYH